MKFLISKCTSPTVGVVWNIVLLVLKASCYCCYSYVTTQGHSPDSDLPRVLCYVRDRQWQCRIMDY